MPTNVEDGEGEVAVCGTCAEEEDECQCWTCASCDTVRGPDDSQCSRCEACSECCTCWTCRGCQRRRSEDHTCCERCNECDNCCECAYCEACECRVEYVCGDCQRCGDCECDCEHGECNVEHVNYGTHFHSASKMEFLHNKSKRYISVEIEVANAEGGGRIETVAMEWRAAIVEDGSLPDTGFEVNTAPASGDKFLRQIKQFCKAFYEQGAEVDDSCGLHVHVDARDFTYYDIRRLIKLYAKIEPALFQCVPNYRRYSRYCTPCAETYLDGIRHVSSPKLSKERIIESIYDTKSTKDVRFQKYAESRYRALNLHSWLFRGTVECRLLDGTVEYEDITNWGKLWATILDIAYTRTEVELGLMASDPAVALLSCCPDDEVRGWVMRRMKRYSND